jgi:hypothetical protein
MVVRVECKNENDDALPNKTPEPASDTPVDSVNGVLTMYYIHM